MMIFPSKTLFYRFLIVCIFVFNLFDAVATKNLIDSGSGYEVNPIVDWILTNHIWAFYPLKFFAGVLFLFVTWNNIDCKFVKLCVVGSFVIYFALFVYYSVGFLFLIR
jgi:hypothetical protein